MTLYTFTIVYCTCTMTVYAFTMTHCAFTDTLCLYNDTLWFNYDTLCFYYDRLGASKIVFLCTILCSKQKNRAKNTKVLFKEKQSNNKNKRIKKKMCIYK